MMAPTKASEGVHPEEMDEEVEEAPIYRRWRFLLEASSSLLERR